MNPQSFLTNILQSPDYNIPIEANYSIYIEGIKTISANLSANSEAIADNKLTIKEKFADKIITEKEVFFATSVNLPGESTASGRVGYAGENALYGGLLSAPILKGRQNLNNLDITFIETNDSFLDYLIRPWVVAASQFGLFTRGAGSTQNFKSDIEVTFYDKFNNDGQNTGAKIRKTIRFKDAVPLEVGGYEAAYGKTVGLRTTKTSWIYSTYEVK